MSKPKLPGMIAGVEKAIAEKYGPDTIANPKQFWTPEKEEQYKEQEKTREARRASNPVGEVEQNGVLISEKLINRTHKNECPRCERYTLLAKDEIYFTKYDCCFRCYVEHIEDR